MLEVEENRTAVRESAQLPTGKWTSWRVSQAVVAQALRSKLPFSEWSSVCVAWLSKSYTANPDFQKSLPTSARLCSAKSRVLNGGQLGIGDALLTRRRSGAQQGRS